MPKIIDNLEETILQEAKKQVMNNGYSATTVRSVAKGCGIAAGTLYNYFPSKDVMVASFMVRDWMAILESAKRAVAGAKDMREATEAVYRSICRYREAYSALFADSGAVRSSAGAFTLRHAQLRGQVAGILAEACARFDAGGGDDFLPAFLAESLLAWSNEALPFEQFWNTAKKLFS
ncbi:MAG: TetR/AcrR family transcriptional regulator [bacterium]|nr:TetR/AcrR family transcriptional regulator [bacterium]